MVKENPVFGGVLVAMDSFWTNFGQKWVVQRRFCPFAAAEILISRGTSAPLGRRAWRSTDHCFSQTQPRQSLSVIWHLFASIAARPRVGMRANQLYIVSLYKFKEIFI